jgi:glucokinase
VPRSETYVLGLGIGLTSISAAAIDPEGNPVVQVQRAARPADPENAVRALIEAAQEAVTRLNSHADRLGAVGLAAPGVLEPVAGICVSCHEFPLWRDVQLARPMVEELNLPVELLGAAQAAALAETRFGAARGLSEVLFVHVGTDIVAAVVSGGRLLAAGPAGGRGVGHLAIEPEGPLCQCGAVGCWAALAGQEALVSRVVEAIEEGARTTLGTSSNGRRAAITPAAICKAAAAGDQAARAALEQTGKYLALGLGNLITMFDPEAVILESTPSTVGAALRRVVESALKASPRASAFSRCVLLSPELGEHAAALGAAAWMARTERG